ncbi:hypothetical protein Pisl_1951 [Pyrobaculum islandicum DSM 4184]|uniref:DUF4276 family protein n=1 Tax=Pyrobaculum islandicum (strain DSM 4184 / JCM 9189 / GEO3) TaxID=384616 RepID=A1RVW6_PYRIL|nr:hypothetical protein [Pyrobaculum islandicum]ABL89098.1 hypothetical protein Pisl_1951 [Pyrobaculum islandicum DSM 4184]
MVARFLFVEDHHGVEFHRRLIEKLQNSGIVPRSLAPKIERIPTGLCNSSMGRKIVARLFGSERWRILFVIDSEGEDKGAAADKRVLRHLRSHESLRGRLDNVRVVVVHPRHEKWLCMGLGGGSCSADPESGLDRVLGRVYKKDDLGKLADRIDVERLLSEGDFREYVEGLRWLLSS